MAAVKGSSLPPLRGTSTRQTCCSQQQAHRVGRPPKGKRRVDLSQNGFSVSFSVLACLLCLSFSPFISFFPSFLAFCGTEEGVSPLPRASLHPFLEWIERKQGVQAYSPNYRRRTRLKENSVEDCITLRRRPDVYLPPPDFATTVLLVACPQSRYHSFALGEFTCATHLSGQTLLYSGTLFLLLACLRGVWSTRINPLQPLRTALRLCSVWVTLWFPLYLSPGRRAGQSARATLVIFFSLSLSLSCLLACWLACWLAGLLACWLAGLLACSLACALARCRS